MSNGVKVSILFLFVFSVASLTASFWWPHSYSSTQTDQLLLSPQLQHPLGTDSLGRDQLARVFFGYKISLSTGIVSTLLTMFIGSLFALLLSIQNFFIRTILMRLLDTLLALPNLVLITIVRMLIPDDRPVVALVLAIAMANWMYIAKVVKGWIEEEKIKTYVQAAHVLGASKLRIMFSHILPNLWPQLVVLGFMQIPYNLLYESYLSFLGLGLKPPFVSFGFLSYEGWKTMSLYPYLTLLPGFFLFLTIYAVQNVGEFLRQKLLREY